MKLDYAAQYKHPQWQKKRLEALENSQWTCGGCGAKETTLHVHHKHYVKGRKVWEYDIAELEVLCEPCHEETHAFRGQIAEAVAMYESWELPELAAVIRGFSRSMIGPPLDDEIATAAQPQHYYVGIIASLMRGLDIEDQVAIATVVLESSRRHRPEATGLHECIEQAIKAFQMPRADA